VYVKPGNFLFGSKTDDPERNLGEINEVVMATKGYCIDKYEFPNRKGLKPKGSVDWHEAATSCESDGKRLCQEREWERACKGAKSARYSYGDAWEEKRCNTEDRRGVDGKLWNSGDNAKCSNDWGIFDMR